MTPEEIAVINTAIRWFRFRGEYSIALTDLATATGNLIYTCDQCNHDLHRCPGCGEPIGHGEGVCRDCDLPAPMTAVDREGPAWPAAEREKLAEQEPAWAEPAEEPAWVLRTMKDVRQGDIVRLPAAPERVAKVLFAQSLDWHAKQGTRSWQYNGNTYWDDTPLEHTLISMRMDYEGVPLDEHGRPALLQLSPDVPVEISLTPTELAAIEALGGWGNRVRMESETS